jgi:hypothetical protein
MMFSKFDEVFKPWKKWENKKLTDLRPCDECCIHKDWLNRAIYGSPAEREDAVMTVPNECKICIKRVQWLTDCLQKLEWYEKQDERLKESK